MKKTPIAFVLAALAVGLQPGTAAASPTPPPGYYRVDMDSTEVRAGEPGQVRHVTEGSSGDTTVHASSPGKSSSRHFKGDKQVTACVPKDSAAPAMPPGALGCSGFYSTSTPNGVVHSAQCPVGKISMRIRQLDATRWEYLVDMAMVSTRGPQRSAGMMHVLEQQVKNAPTAAERAKAREMMAELVKMDKESEADEADTQASLRQELQTQTDPEERAATQAALDAMAPGQPVMQATSRQVWTRIGDACPK